MATTHVNPAKGVVVFTFDATAHTHDTARHSKRLLLLGTDSFASDFLYHKCHCCCARYLGSREVIQVAAALSLSKIVGCYVSVSNISLGCIGNATCNIEHDLQSITAYLPHDCH